MDLGNGDPAQWRMIQVCAPSWRRSDRLCPRGDRWGNDNGFDLAGCELLRTTNYSIYVQAQIAESSPRGRISAMAVGPLVLLRSPADR